MDDPRHRALIQYWERHCKALSEWFLSLDQDAQEKVLLKACPDLPRESALEKQARGAPLLATEIILPELSVGNLLSGKGKILILLLTKRSVTQDFCYTSDFKLLTDLHNSQRLPDFSQGQLAALKEPFVDPLDPSGSIQSLGPEADESTQSTLTKHFSTGRLIPAQVWLALQIRRNALLDFIVAIIEDHQRAATVKPSPTYAALLRGEIEQEEKLSQPAEA